MDDPEIPATDSGYPTPRDDLSSSPRRDSLTDIVPLTSTPVRGRVGRPLKDHFAEIRQDLSMIESANSTVDNNPVLATVKCVLAVSKDLKQKERANSALRDENETLRGENESLREENTTLREESRRIEMMNASLPHDAPFIPKLQLGEVDKLPSGAQIKNEPISFVTNDEGKSLVDNKNMFLVDSKPKVFTATATIQVDTEKMDADVQTENENHVTEINANLQIELDQLQSEIEAKERKNDELKNRLFDYEQMKAKFEDDEKKLRSDLEKKLKTSQEKASRCESKVEELELRLKRKRGELEEVRAENHRLVEDRKTHDFELDELNVQMQEETRKKQDNEKKVEKLTEEIVKLEEDLERERSEKNELEEMLEKVKEDNEKAMEEARAKVEEAVEKEAFALEKLNEIQEENRKIVKENQYLTNSQQALLDSEMNLKSAASVMNVNLRNAEQQVAALNEKLEAEVRNGEMKDAEVFDLKLKNQELEEEKHNSEELLRDLKKGKIEIDHLREQLERLSQNSTKVETLQRDYDELQKKAQLMEQNMQSNMIEKSEFDKKIEEYIRSEASKDAEIERMRIYVQENKSKVSELETGWKEASEEVDKLKKEYAELDEDYQEFKKHATLQYNDQINIRDEEILHLRERLVQLETYPGQSISISKRHTETQTDEIEVPAEKEEDKSPDISLVSEEAIQGISDLEKVEQSIRQFISVVTKEAAGQPQSDNLQSETTAFTRCADVFIEIAEILDAILTDREAPESKIRDCWRRHLSLMEEVEMKLKNEVRSLTVRQREQLENEERRWRKAMEDLGNELNQEKRHHDDIRNIAEGFKEQYELEIQEKDAIKAEYDQLNEYCHTLRADLQQAQHQLQEEKRSSSRKSDEIDEEMIALENTLKRTENDLYSKIKKVEELEKQLVDVRQRRVYDKETMNQLIEAAETMKNKCNYWRKRNTERQKLLVHMRKVTHSVMQAVYPGSSAKALEDLQHRLEASGLAEEIGSEEKHAHRSESSSHRRADSRDGRRVLGDNNRSH